MLKIIKEIILHLSDQLGILSTLGAGIGGAGLSSLLITGAPLLSGDFLAVVIGLFLIILDYFIVFPKEKDEKEL